MYYLQIFFLDVYKIIACIWLLASYIWWNNLIALMCFLYHQDVSCLTFHWRLLGITPPSYSVIWNTHTSAYFLMGLRNVVFATSTQISQWMDLITWLQFKCKRMVGNEVYFRPSKRWCDEHNNTFLCKLLKYLCLSFFIFKMRLVRS